VQHQLRRRHAPRERAAQTRQARDVVDVQMCERDAGDAPRPVAERVDDRDVGLDRLAARRQLERSPEGDRGLAIHAEVDQEQTTVLPLEHEGGVRHHVGRLGIGIERGVEHARARQHLARGVDVREPNGKIGDRRDAQQLGGVRQRRHFLPNRPVPPGEYRGQQHQPAHHQQPQPAQEPAQDPHLVALQPRLRAPAALISTARDRVWRRPQRGSRC